MKPIVHNSKPGLILFMLGMVLTLGGLSVTYAAQHKGNPTTAATQTSATEAGAAQNSASQPEVTATAQPAAVEQQTGQPSPTGESVAVVANGAQLASSRSKGASAQATATPQPTAATPGKVVIKNFPLLAQSYTLSCEYAAASAVTLFWGDQVTEKVFVSEVPSSPNPHLGFRGDINAAFGGINNYGVYAEALVPVLQDYGYNATVFYGGVSRLKANVAAGNPVVVWITTGKYTVRTPVEKTYKGDTFTLVAGEHAVVIYGYDSGGVYIMDVSNGSYQYTAWDSFLTRWSYFDQMSLVITPK